jgi:segregation and condensation protein B
MVIEAALLSSVQPLSVADLRRLFDDVIDPDAIREHLAGLRSDWADRGVRLVELAGGWRFQTAPEVAQFLARLHPEKPPRYSRAVLETLAIVAYRQPVTRGDIEEIRGVTVSSQVVRTLEERGWIEVIGHKDVIGRPELLATTRQFLDDLGLRSLDELPELADPSALLPSGALVEALAAVAGDGTGAGAEPRTEAGIAEPAETLVQDGPEPAETHLPEGPAPAPAEQNDTAVDPRPAAEGNAP